MNKSIIRQCVRGYIHGDMFPDDSEAAHDAIDKLESIGHMETLIDQALDSIGSVQELHQCSPEIAEEVGMKQWRDELPSRLNAMIAKR